MRNEAKAGVIHYNPDKAHRSHTPFGPHRGGDCCFPAAAGPDIPAALAPRP